MNWLRDVFDNLAANHIKGVILSWAIITFVAIMSRVFSINFGDVVSAYHTFSAVMDGLWIFGTVVLIITGVTRKRAGY